jgi:hypothetical protein
MQRSKRLRKLWGKFRACGKSGLNAGSEPPEMEAAKLQRSPALTQQPEANGLPAAQVRQYGLYLLRERFAVRHHCETG